MAYTVRKMNARKKRKQQYKKRAIKSNMKIKRIALNQARKVVNKMAETKYFETYQTPIVFYHLGYYSKCITEIPQGLGLNQRVGTVARPYCVSIKYWIKNNNASNLPKRYRVLIIQYNDTYGSVPSPSIMLDTSTEVSPPALPYSFRFKNVEYLDAGRILYDKIHVVERGPVPSTGQGGTRYFKYDAGTVTKGIKPIVWEKSSATGGISEIAEGSICLYVIDDDGSETDTSEVSYNVRVYYKDS